MPDDEGVAQDGVGQTVTFRQSFDLLAEHGMIEASLAARLANAAGLRNRIAHGYATMEVERLWSEIPAGVATFEAGGDWTMTLREARVGV